MSPAAVADVDALNAELASFSYSISHDLRAPLRAILGYSRAALEDYGPQLDDEGRRLLAVVRDEASRMGEMIDALLDISRLGSRPMQDGPIDMTALARLVADDVTLAAGKPQNVVEVAGLAAAFGDEAMLRRVWVEILGNAVKYAGTQTAPHVYVSSTLDEGGATYHVRDNGVGLDMKHVDKLFGVFQKFHRSADFPGTGAGLAKVKRVVSRHGGTVWLDAHVGKGATFSFRLPAT